MLTESGEIVSWGKSDKGGDSSGAQKELRGKKKQKIYVANFFLRSVKKNGTFIMEK